MMADRVPEFDSTVEDSLSDKIRLSREEEQEVEREIDELMTANRLKISERRLRPRGQRSGLLVPLLVIGCFLLLSGVFAGVTYAFFVEDRQEQIEQSQQSYSSQLVRELLYQFRSRLQEREQEIGSIQDQLQQVESSLNMLEEDIQAEIEARRIELERQLNEEFAQREQELLDQQYGSEEIQQILAEERSLAEQEMEEELILMRDNADLRMAQRESTLQETRSELSSMLNVRQEEMNALQGQIDEQNRLLQEQQLAVELNQQETERLEQQLEETTELEGGYQSLLQERERRQVLEEQIATSINLAINNTLGEETVVDTSQLREILQEEETVQLLGSTKTNTNIRVLDTLDSYRLLREQMVRLQAGDEELLTAEEERRIQQLRDDYLLSVENARLAENSQDSQILREARNRLLSPIVANADIFPEFSEVFFFFDDRIVGTVDQELVNQVQALENQAQELENQARIVALSDAEQVIIAAFGTSEEQDEIQSLLQNDQDIARLYSFVGNSLTEAGSDSGLLEEYNQLQDRWIAQQQEIPLLEQKFSVLGDLYADYKDTTQVELKRSERNKNIAWTVTGLTAGTVILAVVAGVIGGGAF